MVLTLKDIKQQTNGQGVFTITLTNHTQYAQRVTAIAYATIEDNATPFVSQNSIVILADATQTLFVQKPLILGNGIFTKDSQFIISTSDDRKKMVMLTVKLTTISSSGRKDKSFIITPEYYENTRFAHITNITHNIIG